MLSSRTLLLSCLAAAACSDPTAQGEPVQLVIEPAAELRSVLIGSFHQLSARALSANGSSVAASTVTWSTSDTKLASIDSRGEFRVATTYTACNWVTPGECKVTFTARAGNLIASQEVTILPYTPVIIVDVKQLDLEMGDSARLTSKVLLEARDVPWCTVSYVSQDPAIASVDAARGVVTGVDLGSTLVDVLVSGPVCPPSPEPVRVINHIRWHTLSILPERDATLSPGAILQLSAQVRNAKGVEYPASVVTWASSDAAIAVVDSNGVVRALACTDPPCRITITARSGRLTAAKTILVE
jgi:hypothetical protein